MKFTCYKPLKMKAARQQGSAILLALFILVALSLLAISLLRLLADSNRSVANEVYGTRALLAAQSGAELALARLFPIGNGEGVGCDALPADDNGRFALLSGLPNCRVTIDCSPADVDAVPAPDGQIYYRITSQGICQTGAGAAEDAIFVARTIEVEARGLSL